MARLLLLFLIVLAPRSTHAYGAYVNLVVQSYQPSAVEFFYDPNDAITNPQIHLGGQNGTLVGGNVFATMVTVRASSNTALVIPASAAVPGGVTWQVASTTVMVGPRGCDSPDGDINNGYTVVNCATSAAQVYANQQTTANQWWAPFYGENSVFCTSGDFFSCLGKVHIVRPNMNTLVVQDSPSIPELFFAMRTVIFGAAGYIGTELGVVDVQLIKPQLNVTTTCAWTAAGAASGVTFAGVYDAFPYDAYTGMGPDVVLSAQQTYNFAGSQISTARVLVRRTPQNADEFWVEFAQALGEDMDSHYFLPMWETQTAFPILPASNLVGQDGSTPIALAFNESIVSNASVNFYQITESGATLYNSTCTAQFAWLYEEGPPQLKPFGVVDASNWYLQPNLPAWTLSIWGFRLCQQQWNGYLAFPWCPFGTWLGGVGFGEWPNDPAFSRLRRPPDANYAGYSLNCDSVWPTAEFQGYNAQTGDNTGDWFSREDPALDACFMPLLYPAAVFAATSPYTAQEDCARQQADCYGIGCVVCWRARGISFCKDENWIPYDQSCYRKFDPVSEQQYATTGGQDAQICASLDSELPAGASQVWVYTGNPYDVAFLARFLLAPPYDEGQPSPSTSAGSVNTVPYHTTYPNGVSACPYVYETVPGNPLTRVAAVNYCINGVLRFPMCRYQQTQWDVFGRWQSAHSQTLEMFKNGQIEGTAPRGTYTTGRCTSGSSGQACETPTCPAEIYTVFTPSGDTPGNRSILNFWYTCNLNGGCDQWNPNRCACFQYQGPVAYVPGYPQQNPEFTECPCCCPAVPTIGGTFSIDGAQLTDSVSYLVCNGFQNGNCVTNNITGTGQCECVPITNLNPLSPQPFIPQFGGLSCQCGIPAVMPLGYCTNQPCTEQAVCNGRGTCCPTGATFSNGQGMVAGGASSEICYPNGEKNPITGCVCDDGWTGPDCESVAPSNLALNLPVSTSLLDPSATPNVAYIQFTEATVLTAVIIGVRDNNIFTGFGYGDQGCTPQSVWVSATTPTNTSSMPGTPCTLTQIEYQTLWECPINYDVFFVSAVTLETQPRCTFTVNSEYFPACGAPGTTNPFWGRSWATPAYRSYGRYQHQLSPYYAPYGSAYTDCMCGPNNAGPQCGLQVSALVSNDGATFTHIVCGYNTFFPLGQPGTNPNTSLPECQCNPFAGTQATGAFIGSWNGATDETFTGPACAWPLTYNQEAGGLYLGNGHGRPVVPSFPYGQPDYNLLLYMGDATYTPFIAAPGSIANYELHSFNARPVDPRIGGDETRSVITISSASSANNPTALVGSWLLPIGQYVLLENVLNSLGYYCAQTTRLPLFGQLQQPPYALQPYALPQRAVAVVTIWTLTSGGLTATSVETCDPGLYQSTEWAAACSTQNWCPEAWLAYGGIDPPTAPSSSFWTEPTEHTCIAAVQSWSGIPNTLTDFTDVPLWIEPMCSSSVFLQESSANATQNSLIFPPLNCANAVHRVIDKGWWVQYNTTIGYALQCWAQPIQPYMDSVNGAASGLQTDQIPDLPFPQNPAFWSTGPNGQYAMLATLFNGVRTFNSHGIAIDDILTEAMLDQYLVDLAPAVNTSVPSAVPIPAVSVNGSVFALANGPPAVAALANAGPPYSTWLQFHSMSVPWVAWDVIASRPNTYYATTGWTVEPWLQEQFLNVVWSAWAIQTGLGAPLGGLNATTFGAAAFEVFAANPTLAMPGVWQSSPGFIANQNVVIMVIFPANLSAFEVYRNDGVLCGVVFHVVAGTNATFQCGAVGSIAPNISLPQYLSALYTAFDSGAAAALAGEMNSALNATGFVFQAEAMDDWNGVHFRSVPYDWNYEVSGVGTSTTFNNAYNTFATQFMGMAVSVARAGPYAIPAANVRYQVFQESSSQQIDALVESIVVEHTWPYNAVVAQAQFEAVAMGGYTRPFNISLESDQIALRNAYFALFPPTYCTEDVQSTMFSQGGLTTCVYATTTAPFRAWAHGDPTWQAQLGPLALGNQGGVPGYQVYGLGFWDSLLFNMAPIAGYGPGTIAEWAQAVQWQADFKLINPELAATPGPLFNEFQQPFATMLELVGAELIAFMNTSVTGGYASCPWDPSTPGGLCSTGGMVQPQVTVSTATLVIWPQFDPDLVWTPTCTTIWLGAQNFTLNAKYTNNPQELVYWDPGSPDTLTMLQGTPILSSPSRNVTAAQADLEGCAYAYNAIQPVGCVASFASAPQLGSLPVTCTNPALFSAENHVDVQGYFVESITFWLAQISTF